MRRQRPHLQVSTFPFLAVLLCAMGALILVLLCMDRKARQATLAKAQEEANAAIRERQAEHARLAEQRKRDHDGKKRSAQKAWEKKRDDLRARVHAEEQALSKELAEVQARLARAALALQKEQGSLEEVREQLARERLLLERQEQAVAEARKEAKGAAQQVAASDKSRAQLSAELRRLEKALADAVAARKVDPRTYSLIPYHGKRGEDRRPVYVECGPGGFVFHPQKKTLTGRDDLRAELKSRVAQQQERLKAAGVGDSKPYVMLLVRPDREAISRYYEMQAAARELGIDFGYEFVEADWLLDFPEGDSGQPLMASSPPASPPPPNTTQRVSAKPIRLGGGAAGGTAGTLEGGAQAGPQGNDRVAAGGPSLAAFGTGSEKQSEKGCFLEGEAPAEPGSRRNTGSAGASPSTSPTASNSAEAPQVAVRLLPGNPEFGPGGPPQANGGVPSLGTPSTGGNPAAGGNGGIGGEIVIRSDPGLRQEEGGSGPRLLTPMTQSPAALETPSIGQSPDTTVPLPPIGSGANSAPAVKVNATSPPAGQGSALEPPPLLPETGGKPVAAAEVRGPASSSVEGAAANKDNGPSVGPAVVGPAEKAPSPRPLRPARLSGGGDSLIFVECKNDVVIVHPTRKQIAIESLNHSPAYNPLLQAVRQQMQSRQRLGGEAVKVGVRFLVHPDGERTFHLAYPAVDPLKLPMTRYRLQAWDDVSRIVSEE